MLSGLHCRFIKFKPKAAETDQQYPELLVQQKPQIWIIVHQLLAWVTQGPNPSMISSSSRGVQKRKGSSTAPKVERQIVCHYDQATSHGSKLQYTDVVEIDPSLVPHRYRCLSKKCANPKCLHYGTQSHNAKTGKHHRVQKDKHSKKGKGGKCLPSCKQCRNQKSYKPKQG